MSTVSYSMSQGITSDNSFVKNLTNSIINDVETVLNSITISGNSVIISFAQQLPDNDLVALNNIIMTIDPPTTLGNKFITFRVNDIIKYPSYSVIFSFDFPGSRIIQNITNIKFSGYMNPGASSYSIRIYDVTNSNIIASNNFYNSQIMINDIGLVRNIPYNPAVLEVQCKCSGSGLANLSSFTIYYD